VTVTDPDAIRGRKVSKCVASEMLNRDNNANAKFERQGGVPFEHEYSPEIHSKFVGLQRTSRAPGRRLGTPFWGDPWLIL
jgi:hypothetical protein